MDALFLKILNMSISALWVVPAVVALRLLLRKAPKWVRVLLWAAVGLRLVLPEIPVSDLSLIPSAQTIPPDIVYAAQPAIQSGVPVINTLVNPVLGQSLAATPQLSMNPVQKLLVIGQLLWVLGMAAMAVYAFVSWLRIRLRVRESVKEDGVWLCDRIPAPFILGVFRPRIYLPSNLKSEDRPFVLAHERAHLSRKDHWWKPLGFLLLTVHWFNPALWLAYILLCRDIELACDEKVMKTLGEAGKKPYAQALIDCAVKPSMLSACPLAFGENSVKGRLKAILNYKKPAFWLITLAVVACLAVGVCFLTNPADQPESPEATVQRDQTKPPALTAAGAGNSVEVKQLSYDWAYPAEDGKTGHVIADGPMPTEATNLPVLTLLPAALGHNTVALEFERLPDRITVTCYTPGGQQVLESDGVQFFDLLEGNFVYGIRAEWEDAGSCEYAFRGSFNVPHFGYIPSEAEQLRTKYPQYFDLTTDKGLEVYIWQMAPLSYSSAQQPGRNMSYSTEEIWDLHKAPVTMEEMRAILATYNIPREEIFLMPVQMPHSSYWYEIDEEYRAQVERLFWNLDDWGVGMSMVFTEGTKFRLTVTATPPAGATMYTGSEYAVAKYGENGQLEMLVSKPDVAWDLVAYIILPEGGYTQDGDLSFVYDALPPGVYQLQKRITCEYPDGRREERIYSCDFAITD